MQRQPTITIPTLQSCQQNLERLRPRANSSISSQCSAMPKSLNRITMLLAAQLASQVLIMRKLLLHSHPHGLITTDSEGNRANRLIDRRNLRPTLSKPLLHWSEAKSYDLAMVVVAMMTKTTTTMQPKPVLSEYQSLQSERQLNLKRYLQTHHPHLHLRPRNLSQSNPSERQLSLLHRQRQQQLQRYKASRNAELMLSMYQTMRMDQSTMMSR